MKLDIEQAKKYLQGMHRLWLCDEWGQPYDSERCKYCDSHDDCLDIVLAQAAALSDIAQDLYDTFEAMQHENEQLNAALDKAVDMIGDNSRCPTDYRLRKCSNFETCLHCWKDWLLGGKDDGKTDI